MTPPDPAVPRSPQQEAYEQFDAMVGILEEHIENVEFLRRMRESSGGPAIADDETEMPSTRVFKADIELMRRYLWALSPDPRTQPSELQTSDSGLIPLDPLKALSATWREKAARLHTREPDPSFIKNARGEGREACADELDALLAVSLLKAP